MRTTADIRGAQDVIDALVDMTPREANNLMRSTVHAMAGEIRNDMRRTAPDDPSTKKNDLKRSISSKRERSKPMTPLSTVRIAKRAFHWLFLEYGTSKMRAQPFIMPATERFRVRTMDSFLMQFGKKLEAAWKRRRKRGR